MFLKNLDSEGGKRLQFPYDFAESGTLTTTPTFDQPYLLPQHSDSNINDCTMFLELFKIENIP